MTRGLYTITCLTTGKVYVGQSLNIEKRWGDHRRKLEGGKHRNRHLQRAFAARGAANFAFKVHAEIADGDMNGPETALIFALRATDRHRGFNIKADGTGGPLAEETKQLLSKARKGRKLSPEHAAKVAKASVGRKHSEESKRAVSVKLSGREFSAEWRANISAALRGRTRSEASRQKQALTLRGGTHTPESRAKRSASLKITLAAKKAGLL